MQLAGRAAAYPDTGHDTQQLLPTSGCMVVARRTQHMMSTQLHAGGNPNTVAMACHGPGWQMKCT